MNLIIKITNLTKVYDGAVETRALKGINISIPESKITAIIGQSGSGKSTLLNLIGTLDKISTGSIIIDNKDISIMDEVQLAEFRNTTMGFVFQSHYLLPEFGVLENVLIPAWINNNYGNAVQKRAEKLLEYTGILEQKNKSVTAISGGQKQRTAIARALMNNPKIVLADEPTGNLDSETSNKILELFEKINREQKTTFIIITHDDRVAARAQKVIELHDGNIVEKK